MEFLLEISTEEMPPSHVREGLEQLAEGLARELRSRNLVNRRGECGRIRTFGTCRRLVVSAQLAPRQQDKQEVVLGPPSRVAFDPQGKPTPAAKGFARAQGVDVDSLQVLKTEKGEYAALKRTIQGRSAREVLPVLLPNLISRLLFPR